MNVVLGGANVKPNGWEKWLDVIVLAIAMNVGDFESALVVGGNVRRNA
jgi:hypothetical protein